MLVLVKVKLGKGTCFDFSSFMEIRVVTRQTG